MKTDVYDEKTGATTQRPRGGNESKEEQVRKMQEAGTPGPVHKALDVFAGEWQAEVKCWMEPGGAATVSRGTAKVTWIFGGRYLQEDFSGEMMGQPFTGRWVMGYNNTSQKYQSLWVDSCNTGMAFSEGKGESDGRVITLEGTTDCASSGQKDISMKQILRVQSADKHTVEMFNDNQKVMEITYTRR